MNTVHVINNEKDAAECHKQNNEGEDVVDKFKIYRLRAETKERELEEAQAVVSKLKDEANFSKEVEKNLIIQLSSAQKRLTKLQSTLNKFIIVADKQKNVEKTCHQIEQRLEELDKLIREGKTEARSLSEKVTKEADLVRKNEEIKSTLAAKNSKLVLMETKIQALLDGKFEFESRIKELEEEVEKRKRENSEMKSNWDQTLSSYKRQIEDNEKRILEYERERKNLLAHFIRGRGVKEDRRTLQQGRSSAIHVRLPDRSGKMQLDSKIHSVTYIAEDFEVPKEPVGNPEFTWADSTVSINPEERFCAQNREKLPQDEDEDIFFQSHPVIRSPFKRKKLRTSFAPKALSQKPREKPELEFLTQNRTSPAVSAKRKLFSPSCNDEVNLCLK